MCTLAFSNPTDVLSNWKICAKGSNIIGRSILVKIIILPFVCKLKVNLIGSKFYEPS